MGEMVGLVAGGGEGGDSVGASEYWNPRHASALLPLAFYLNAHSQLIKLTHCAFIDRPMPVAFLQALTLRLLWVTHAICAVF